MKIKIRLFLAVLAGLFCTELHAGNLKVNLAPTQAVNAGAQWRVDGGAWRNSGVSVNGLSNGTHQVTFSAVNGWIAPAATNVMIVNGTNTFNYTYVQAASLKVTLTPGTAQWRVDGGAWQASAATVANLAPGAHAVDYAPLSGYSAPSSESVTLIAGQLTSLNRSFTQLASLTVTLAPGTAQWRLDGGAWQASGAVLSNLSVGAHTVDYAPLAGYVAPGSESVNLTGGASSLSRAYAVAPASLTINLTPASTQWRVDGGAWRNSGATATNLSAGNHTVDYSPIAGYTTPSSESVALTAGQSASLSRAYVQLAQVTVTLSPASAQFRIDGGAWLNSGTTVSNLSPGSHTIGYSDVPTGYYVTPQDETITLGAGQSLSHQKTYVQVARVQITLIPGNTGAGWRVDQGPWQPSGTDFYVLPGNHVIEYGPLFGYDAPPSDNLTLAGGDNFTATRTYSSQKPTLQINLSPAGQWRIDGGAWQASGATVTELDAGNHSITYTDIGGAYAPLASETVSLALRDRTVLNRAYSLKPAAVSVTLQPNTAQWQVDGGDWQASGATVGNLAFGVSHTITYSAPQGYETPASETFAPASGELVTISRTCTQLASFTIGTITPSEGQWRIDGGDWSASSLPIHNLSLGTHTIEYSNLDGYITPPPQTLTFVSGMNYGPAVTYTQLASLYFSSITPQMGAWRIDGGAWNGLSTQVYNLALGEHLIEFKPVDGYLTPAPQTITLTGGMNPGPAVAYTQLASLYFSSITPYSGSWRIDGGDWHGTYDQVYNLSLGEHLIEFKPLEGYITPAARTITLTSGMNFGPQVTYTQLASLYFSSITPYSGSWRIDGGDWHGTYDQVYNLSLGEHLIEFKPLEGYITPPSQTITLTSGMNLGQPVTYTQLASLYFSNITPYTGEWRIDGGAWNGLYTQVYNLALGEHLIEFKPLEGYVTPPSQTITLTSGMNLGPPVTYTPLATLYFSNINPSTGEWRVDGGPWNSTYTPAYNLSTGYHFIEFKDLDGYATPPATGITLVPGMNYGPPVTYTPLPQFMVLLDLSMARWRLDGGRWNAGGTIGSATAGNHVIEYSTHEGYVTPYPDFFDLQPGGGMLTFSKSYAPDPAFVINPALAITKVMLDPEHAEWRLDGGNWNVSGATLHNLSVGMHEIEYKPVADYLTPPLESITLATGTNPTLYSDYISLDPAQLTVTTTPVAGQWRAYLNQWPAAGPWNASGTTVTGLNPGSYVIEYAPVTGYASPSSGFVQLARNGSASVSGTYYPMHASLRIMLNPSNARYRISGGAWRSGSTMWLSIAPGTYTIDFEPVSGYLTPASVQITLDPGENEEHTYSYTPQ